MAWWLFHCLNQLSNPKISIIESTNICKFIKKRTLEINSDDRGHSPVPPGSAYCTHIELFPKQGDRRHGSVGLSTKHTHVGKVNMANEVWLFALTLTFILVDKGAEAHRCKIAFSAVHCMWNLANNVLLRKEFYNGVNTF